MTVYLNNEFQTIAFVFSAMALVIVAAAAICFLVEMCCKDGSGIAISPFVFGAVVCLLCISVEYFEIRVQQTYIGRPVFYEVRK